MSKKTALIDATKSLLWEKGYEATSPRDIQAASQAGQGSFYHHFGSKKELAIAALEDISAEMISVFQSRLRSKGPARERLMDYLAKTRDARKGCRMGRLANEATMADPELNEPVKQYFLELTSLLAEVIREAQKEGSLKKEPDAMDLAVSMVALVQGGFVMGQVLNQPDIHKTIARGMESLLV